MSALGRIVPLVAVVLFAAACTSEPPRFTDGESSGATPTTAASGAAAATDPPVTVPSSSAGVPAPVSAGRQFLLGTLDSGGESFLSVGAGGIVELTRKYSDRAVFAPTAITVGGDEFQLKTGKLVVAGEPWCLGVHGAGRAQRLKTVACDTADKGQVFTFPLSRDGKGRAIVVNNLVLYAEEGSTKVIVKKPGEGNFPAFVAVDRGRSTITQLGGN